jgi:hypothetical protein
MNGNDDEWEYEYDDNETEDFYIPIDLSNVPSAQIPTNSERRPGHPTLLKSRLRALNATRGQLPESTIDSTNTDETATMGEMQITGLHTTNPLIVYNGQLLSCHWTSTIGTDMFFTKPRAEADDQHQPLRSLPSVDLLSLGTAKLVAKVGRLRPRDEIFEDEENAQAPATSMEGLENEQNGLSAPTHTTTGGDQSASTHLNTASTSFLAKLNEAKAKRGEHSRLALARTPDGSRLVSEPAAVAMRREENGPSRPTNDVQMGGT